MKELEPIETSCAYPQGLAVQELCDGTIRNPGEAYERYVKNREAQGLDAPEVYFTTTITTGGFFRDKDMPFQQAMDANHRLARGLADGVIRKYDLDPQTVMLPSELGKVAGWSQSDYLLFWTHIIYGSHIDGALNIDEQYNTPYYQQLTEIMSNGSFSEDLRRQAYTDLVRYMESLILAPEATPGTYNRPLLVPLVDDDLSLGCYGERIWKSRWHNPIALWQNQQIQSGEPISVFHDQLTNWDHGPQHPVSLTAILPELSVDTKILITRAQQLGATILGQSHDPKRAQIWEQFYDADQTEA